jgi:predicted enzyme related to lactoylglutathione lyase
MSDFTARPGDFCWFELATTDQAAATRFYETLFGWSSADFPMGPSEVYTIFRLGGRDAAAACTMRPEQRAQGVPPNWLVYVLVENADAASSRAAALGGTVMVPPFDVMESGRMSVIADPAGAGFAVWQAKQHAGVGVKGGPGSVVWADLQVRDQAKAGAFYSALFGWKMVEGKSMNPAKPGSYYHIVNGETMIGGIPPADQVDPNAHPAWLMYVQVADCAASTKQAASLGGRAYVDTIEIEETGRISVIADPQGAVFALHQAHRR